MSYSWAHKDTCSTVHLDEIQAQTLTTAAREKLGKIKRLSQCLHATQQTPSAQFDITTFDFSGPTYLDIVAANGVIAGTSVQGSSLPGDLSDQEAVHFGSMALEDTNALPTLKSAQTGLALVEIEGSHNTFPQQKDATTEQFTAVSSMPRKVPGNM